MLECDYNHDKLDTAWYRNALQKHGLIGVDVLATSLAASAVLGVMLCTAHVLKAPRFVKWFSKPNSTLLNLESSIAIEAKRRVVLIDCKGRHLLLLVGGSQDTVIGWLDEERVQ